MDTITFKELKSLGYDDFIQFAPEIFQVTNNDSIQIDRCDLNSLAAIHVVRKVFGCAQGAGAGRIAAQICLDGDIPIQDAAWVVIDLNAHKHIQGGLSELIAAQEYITAHAGYEAIILTGFRTDCAQQDGMEITVIMGFNR